MTMDPIMQQASQVQAEIAALFKEVRFYAMGPGGTMAQASPIRLEYYWPERYGLGFARGVPDDARYLVMANVQLPGYFIQARAVCNPKDQPIRKLGRAIALMRLATVLKPLGWKVFVSSSIVPGNRHVIPPLGNAEEDFPPCPSY
jgi:hypothetical protein